MLLFVRQIPGGLRAWRKKCSELIWKHEMLNSSKVEDLFFYNYKDEFDWSRTLQFISNRNNYTSWETDKEDILYEKSEILVGKEKYWELIRGVYNCKFNKASKDKEEKEMINELWNFCFNELKKKFWIKGCNEINEIEQNLGIKKCKKRVRKIVDRDVYKEENTRKKLKNNEKIKNREYNIKLVTKIK
ncbi:hypothetical protein RhiirB3_428380 [Rhizophagus irregularis]|nr:hypothetical protein RhiirB3_428380 [Rhizophagus irregularis]